MLSGKWWPFCLLSGKWRPFCLGLNVLSKMVLHTNGTKSLSSANFLSRVKQHHRGRATSHGLISEHNMLTLNIFPMKKCNREQRREHHSSIWKQYICILLTFWINTTISVSMNEWYQCLLKIWHFLRLLCFRAFHWQCCPLESFMGLQWIELTKYDDITRKWKGRLILNTINWNSCRLFLAR